MQWVDAIQEFARKLPLIQSNSNTKGPVSGNPGLDLLMNREELVVNVAAWAVVLTRVQGPEEDWESKKQSCLDFRLQETNILLT